MPQNNFPFENKFLPPPTAGGDQRLGLRGAAAPEGHKDAVFSGRSRRRLHRPHSAWPRGCGFSLPPRPHGPFLLSLPQGLLLTCGQAPGPRVDSEAPRPPCPCCTWHQAPWLPRPLEETLCVLLPCLAHPAEILGHFIPSSCWLPTGSEHSTFLPREPSCPCQP